MTKIYSPDGELLAAREIARWANKVHKQSGGNGSPFETIDFSHSLYDGGQQRLKGHLCNCGVDDKGFSNGEFTLLPLNDESVVAGGKAYMKCRNCEQFAHL